MAATITADMKSCHRQLGRPPISDTDKKQRQQEAYKKRDASRVYLASSYERWKRLGGQLGLKDSSLAWHLMEAHANNCDECGLHEDKSAEDESNMERQKNPSQFFPALVRSIHKLCHRYYSFGDCVQVVGLICLEVDNGKKENFSIKEMVHKPFMFQLGKNNKDCINNKHNDLSMNKKCSKDENYIDDSENDESDHGIGEDFMETNQFSPTNKDKSTGEETGKDIGLENGNEKKSEESKELNNSTQSDERDSSFISVGDEEYDVNKNHKENVQIFSSPITHDVDLYSDHPRIYTNTENTIQGTASLNQYDDDHVHAETTEDSADDSINKLVICDTSETTQDTSLPLSLDGNISQSKCDNSLSNNNSFSNNAFIEETPETKENLSYPSIQSKPEMCNNHNRDIPQKQDFTVSAPEDIDKDIQIDNERYSSADLLFLLVCSISMLQSVNCVREVDVSKEKVSGDHTNFKQLDIQIPPESCLGLDLSIVKTETPDNFQSPDNMFKSNRKRKSSEMEPLDKEASGTHFSPSYLNGNTRREIVYKVEYEHLEKNPFCDFYELTARYPNIQQRTFYRWKRKIKDEFIFLEQNPDLTFEQFCACVSHAKPEVFEIWKKLIKDGHRFSSLHVSPSDTSPSLPSSKKPEVYNASLALLQMYPHMSFQEFSYTHPMISNEVFLSYKQQVLSAISHVEQNPNLEYIELVKQYKFITEDAFNAWKKYAQMINAQKVVKPVKEERCDKPTQADLYAMQSAMLQQYPMLMGTAGFAAYNALINQAMASSTSGGQFYPALMQAAVNQAHHQYLPNQWQQPSLAAVNPQSILQAQQQLLKQTTQQSSLSKLQSLTQVLCNNMKECDKSSLSSSSPDNSSPIPTDNTLKKQNKNEYMYFIYHPDITYSEFNLHYPHISNRTFYRWKKEVKDAQNLLSDNPRYTYEELCSDFPNIPQDIFESWKLKKNKIRNSPQKVWRPHDTGSSTTANSQDIAIREPNRILKAVLENDNPTDIIKIPQYKPLEYQQCKHKAVDESTSKVLLRSEEFEYVQLNPTISFDHFETIFTNVTEDQFNQWKQHINDCMNLICTNPDMNYDKFQSIVPDISEDVFNRWKYYQVATNIKQNEDRNHFLSPKHYAEKDNEKIPSSEDDPIEEEKCPDSKSNPSHNKQRKQARAEYLCLQENPFVDLQEVISAFPSVSKRTLYRWKKEILQAVEFVRSQPEISYNSFIQFFPEVLESNFNRWKKAINAASTAMDNFQHDQNDHLGQNQVIPRQQESPTESPNMVENHYERQSEPSSIPETYTHHDDNEQDGSSSSSKPEDLSSPEMDDLPRCERRDFRYILENPDIDFEKFNVMFPNTLQYNFYKWRNDIHRWISLVMSSPHIDYNIFSIYCQEVPEEIFNEWRKAAIKNINGRSDTADQSFYQQTAEDVDHTLSSTEMNNNEINNSTLTNSTYFKSLKTLTPRSRKVNLREYHYFIQNPYMTFQELNEMFNTISGRTFYRWKKEVKEKLEYLEINHDADFKGFSKLFPEVSEDVFVTWKQKARVNSSKRNAGGGGNWWNVNHQSNGEDQKQVVASESSKDSFESQTSSRYTVLKEEEDREVNETAVKSPASPINYCSQKRLLNSSYEKEEKYMKREGESQFTDTSNTIQQMLHQYSNNYINYGITPNSSMYSQILTSTSSPYIMNPGIKHENSTHNLASSASIFPTNANLPKRPLSSPMTSMSPSTNCDEIYSPKFRKRQREEYCYLQQNPTMDFNEFTSHFPRVSIRTFYRWKKELKDDR
ncbi:hypothetical protein LOTGIDRAFT_235314 [Lottia gigantea]|uniref:Vertnin n=1 Tax=Lottia gigantea TaxID=225164 RepID=V3Z6R6_LOTGI|nr:hypothetical protein LOTGIDRAFT_235314 [Lottia gigantea]ESO86493.1 hypothetical protein LOTGIDRAFT_235314 [Lottia gigantea]